MISCPSMKSPPSLAALEIALILARKAAAEALVDPGGTMTAQLDACPFCLGGAADWTAVTPCPKCGGDGAVRVVDLRAS
jgi:hypothetical protein